MRTAIDTNILLDIFLPDPKFGPGSKLAMERQFASGSLILGEVTYSELAAFFPDKKLLDESLASLGIEFVPSHEEICYLAGMSWKKYRQKGGVRHRVIGDFLIAAHAEIHADLLLTRDRGFYRQYFPNLKIMEP